MFSPAYCVKAGTASAHCKIFTLIYLLVVSARLCWLVSATAEGLIELVSVLVLARNGMVVVIISQNTGCIFLSETNSPSGQAVPSDAESRRQNASRSWQNFVCLLNESRILEHSRTFSKTHVQTSTSNATNV